MNNETTHFCPFSGKDCSSQCALAMVTSSETTWACSFAILAQGIMSDEDRFTADSNYLSEFRAQEVTND